MALRNILTDEDALLRKQSREVKEITPRIRELIGDMWDTLYQANGIGLAAPQVGVLRRVVVVDTTPPAQANREDAPEERADSPVAGDAPEVNAVPDEPAAEQSGEPPCAQKYVLINPEILSVSEETVIEKEGCLSVPGFVGTVERPVRVRVRAQNEEGEVFEVESEGLLAKAFCHEIDHLEGILYTDLATEIEEVSAADNTPKE